MLLGYYIYIVQVTTNSTSTNSSDTVEVKENKTPDNPENKTPEKPITSTVGKLEQNATGNPLALLALAFAMFVLPLRRKR